MVFDQASEMTLDRLDNIGFDFFQALALGVTSCQRRTKGVVTTIFFGFDDHCKLSSFKMSLTHFIIL